ncbi:MAG: hypothetical protein KAW88_09330, partial [Candidatus Cloacimonetes bacterium]|nr:hypothetical protein [Candidatus Cloacimonadota bacterium]
NQAVTLIKFTSLPDSFYAIEDANLILSIKNKHNFDIIDNTTLKIGRIINEDWYESTALWNAPTDSTSWSGNEFSLFNGDDFELIPDLVMTLEEDSLVIVIPEYLIENWIDTDSLNFGLALYTPGGNCFLEINSSENGNDDLKPFITYDYQETDTDTLITNTVYASHDITIFYTDDEYTTFPGQLILSNIQPIKMFMKFDLPDSIFTNEIESDIQDTVLFIQRLTINKADLILKNNGVNAYPLDGTIYIDPFIMTADSTSLNWDDTSFPLLSEDDYEDLYISSSSDSLTSEEFKVDIMKIVQSFTSGEYDNYGVMLKSIYENKDFIHLEFDLEPEIQITFTPPYLDE